MSANNNTVNNKLLIAVTVCPLDKVKSAIEAGASAKTVNKEDVLQSSVLHIATRRGNPDIVAYLLSHGAEINVQDSGGDTPLHEAVRRALMAMKQHNEAKLEQYITIIKCLSEYRANWHLKNNKFKSPFEIAQKNLEMYARIQAVCPIPQTSMSTAIAQNSSVFVAPPVPRRRNVGMAKEKENDENNANAHETDPLVPRENKSWGEWLSSFLPR